MFSRLRFNVTHSVLYSLNSKGKLKLFLRRTICVRNYALLTDKEFFNVGPTIQVKFSCLPGAHQKVSCVVLIIVNSFLTPTSMIWDYFMTPQSADCFRAMFVWCRSVQRVSML